MLGLYGCARKPRIPGYQIIYNDIEKRFKADLICDIKTIDFSEYDYFIMTPPCNYYSKANYRRDTSKVALETKDLLPYCLKECINTSKPFIVENVNNQVLLPNTIRIKLFR